MIPLTLISRTGCSRFGIIRFRVSLVNYRAKYVQEEYVSLFFLFFIFIIIFSCNVFNACGIIFGD